MRVGGVRVCARGVKEGDGEGVVVGGGGCREGGSWMRVGVGG